MFCRLGRLPGGVWLAAVIFAVAGCAQPSGQPTLGSQAPARTGSEQQAASSAAGLSGNAPVDSAQSQALTTYLHTHRLPLVSARVVSGSPGPRQVILYGFVASAFGKTDAADKAREFLKDPTASVDNRIKVAPEIANRSGTAPPATSDDSNADLKAYQDQGLAQEQRRQYRSQGFAGLTPLPLFGLFGRFGSGSMGYGFGGGPFGSPYGGYGPGWGAYPPYPVYPGPPGMGYPAPYGPYHPFFP